MTRGAEVMENVVDDQMLERLRKGVKVRLKMVHVLAAAVGVASFGFMIWVFFLESPKAGARIETPLWEKLAQAVLGPAAVAVLAWAFLYWLMVKSGYDRFNSQFKNKYVLSTIQETSLFQNLSYQPQGGLTYDEMRSAAVVSCGDRRYYESEDMLSGCYQELRFRYCDVVVGRVVGAGKNRRVERIFQGQVIHFAAFDEIKKSADHVQIFEKNLASDLKGWTAKHKIQTENEAFNRRFQIFADDEHNAFYILTPKLLEQITQFADQAGAQIAIAFQGSAMFVAIDRMHSILDASIHVPVLEQKQLILKDMELLCQAGDILILEASALNKG